VIYYFTTLSIKYDPPRGTWKEVSLGGRDLIGGIECFTTGHDFAKKGDKKE